MTEAAKGKLAGFRAKKRLGQHFLTDRNILKKIVEAAEVKEGDRVLEIGPGPGTLTETLLEAGARVVAVEADRDLFSYLEGRFAGRENFKLLRGDILKFSFAELVAGKRFKLVSNPPYNITGPILFKLIDERELIERAVLMLQKEVAQRITARPGTKDYGSLTVLLALYYDVKKAFGVSKNLFRPRPAVDSTVVVLRPVDGTRFDVGDEAFFRRIVRAAFSTRRKKILNSLASMGLEKRALEEALHEAAVEPGARAETVSLKRFAALARALAGRPESHETSS